MHMSDALITPLVGGVMWAVAAGLEGHSALHLRRENAWEGQKIPLMGVMGAFVFAAQMINFTIPGTGSSGHLSGALLLSAMLGPAAGFLTIAAILLIQCLFFADGGLLALGCNVFNMGFFACYLIYPLLFAPLLRTKRSPGRLMAVSMLSALVTLVLGALAVVVQTALSGRTELPFGHFAALMLPIHLAIGVGEGLVTGGLLVFLNRVAPESITGLPMPDSRPARSGSAKKAVAILAVFALLTGGVLSWFASSNPDGLEWSMLGVAGTAELEAQSGVHQAMEDVQAKSALMPDYALASGSEDAQAASSVVNGGTSLAGVLGSAITLLLAAGIGVVLHLSRSGKRQSTT